MNRQATATGRRVNGPFTAARAHDAEAARAVGLDREVGVASEDPMRRVVPCAFAFVLLSGCGNNVPAAAPTRMGQLTMVASSAEEVRGSFVFGAHAIVFDAVAANGGVDPLQESGPGQVVATFSDENGHILVTSTVTGQKAASMTLGGYSYAGNEAFDAGRFDALLAFDGGTYGAAMAMIPLELGCVLAPDPATGEDPTAALRQALLLPSQIFSFEDPSYPDWPTLDASAACTYFGARNAPDPAGLELSDDSDDDSFPSVYMFWTLGDGENLALFDFNENGMWVDEDWKGKPWGPCAHPGPEQSVCRGACGAGCITGAGKACTLMTTKMCEKQDGANTGNEITTDAYHCGYDTCCVDHDNCYDNCRGKYRCGDTWRHRRQITGCKRGCDFSKCLNNAACGATAFQREENCRSFRRGGGRVQPRGVMAFSGYYDYSYDSTAANATACPPPEKGMETGLDVDDQPAGNR
ncbi:MAG TPA: hypothetical protein VGL86_16560 [Polyangia bacterium]